MKNDQYESRDSNVYRTGSTTPPKKHSGLVAVLLVMVIFLAGLVSILSVLNIKLFSNFQKLQQSVNVPMSLQSGQDSESNPVFGEAEPADLGGSKSIGIMGDTVKPAYQTHFHLPEGLFITHVAAQSTAHRQGIQEGDVLISLDDVSIIGENSLRAFLEARSVGSLCTAVIYRRDTDTYLSFTLTIEEIEP